MSGVHKMGEPVKASEKDDGMASFSIRIPQALADQIDARRKVSKRSRNKEVELMLERQLETEVARDKAIVDKIAEMNITPQSNQT